jgi:hypothetical protein
MRNSWLISENGVFMGVNLGSDFCAEHEWDFDELKLLLGIPGAKKKRYSDVKRDYGNLYGMDRRRALAPKEECVLLKEEEDTLNLVVVEDWAIKNYRDCPIDERRGGELAFHKGDTLVTAWSSNDLMVRVKGEDNFKKLRTLHEALMAKKCAVWLGGGGIFENAGLCIAIVDTIPAEHLKTMRDADLDREKLEKAAESTGIRAKLEAASNKWLEDHPRTYFPRKCSFYALSPAWAKGHKKKTKHKVVFWLNPQDQEHNNWGWFTVEELEQWIDGKGPIPKNDTKPVKS